MQRLAEAVGTAYLDGREMLLHQGIPQFAALTGKVPPKESMRAAISGGR